MKNISFFSYNLLVNNMFGHVQDSRIKKTLLIILIILLIILIRVFWIEVIEYKELNTLANNLWSRNLPVEADRGNIYDRNGKVIASSVTTVGLVLIPNQITNKEMVTKALADILNISYEEMYKHVNKKTLIERVHPEGRRLDPITAEKISNYNFDGVYLVKESKRYYNYEDILAHVIGYVGIDNQGLSGLELKYDKYLTGKNGSIKYYSDGKGKKLEMAEIYEAPKSGNDLYLTIDLDIQLALERELNNAVSKYDADGAIGIVMDPASGEILAMSSRPTFENENYQNYNEEVINRNLAIWSNFEPGSTFKIITLASSIEEGIVNIFEDKYNDTGSVKVGGATLHCWKEKGHGVQTYLQVVENSCNPGFVNLGLKLGKEKLFQYIKKFGFGSKTGIDLNGESKGIIFDINKIGDLETATTAFGQGVSVTAIQQVSAVSAVINNGIMYIPYVVSSVKDENKIIYQKSPIVRYDNLISKNTSSLVKYALESVVANGSGRNAYIENYRVGGKTGTAQKVGPNGRYMIGNYVLSFIGFMPADNPKYVIYIAIDHAKGVTQYGGTVAAPIAKNVFKEIISLYDLEKSSESLPKEYRWDDIKYIEIPNVINMNKKDASKILKDFTIEYSGSGDRVIDVSPEAGTKIKENGIVKLLLN